MSNPATEFQIEEYKSLRAEIFQLWAEARTLRLQSLVGTAAVYAWFVVNCENNLANIALFIPILFPIAGVLRYYQNNLRINDISSYIVEIEGKIYGDHGGWERRPNKKAGSLHIYLFWMFLLIVNVVVIVCSYYFDCFNF